MPFLYEVCEERGEKFIEITGYDGEISILTVPQQLRANALEEASLAGNALRTELALSAEMLPVRSIGSHAFEGRRDLREVYLPDTMRRLRAFAFHNCAALRKLSLYDLVEDYYDGVLRHCTSLRLIELYGDGKQYSLMRAILEDNDSAMRFLVHLPQGDIRLSFPEYALIASENTMARTIQFAYEGGGYAYRQCIRKREIRYREYDRLFSFTMRDDPEMAAEIAVDRLMYPYNLDELAKQLYAKFLSENAALALRLFILNREEERILFVAREGFPDEDAILEGLQLASERKETAICAILMDSGKRERRQFSSRDESDTPVQRTAADERTVGQESSALGHEAGDVSIPDFGLELEDW